MKERIAAFVREQAYRPLSAAELADALNVSPAGLERFERALAELEKSGQIILTRAGRYGVPERMNLAVGRVQAHPRGFGFLIPDNPGTDIFLGKESLNGAMHGDRVVVRLTAAARDGRPEGEVIRILSRAQQRLVGTYEQAKWGGYVTPDDRRIPEDVLIPRGASAGARPGDKVVMLITRYPDGRKPAEGRVVERLGRADDPDVEIQAIVRKHSLPEAFPQKVQREAEAVAAAIAPEDLQGRRDLRQELIVTIDGADAKDLDDAISITRLSSGNWELGVHIADVSYYVKENSALDREAYNRGTSVYFADRVIPMLPPRLSNGICSLNPQEDRLTLSCTMEIDAAGKVLRYDIYPSVIRSAERLTYTEVSALLENEPGAITEKLAPLEEMLRDAGELAEILRQRRILRGALDFDLPEAKLVMGEEGVPSAIYRADRRVANRLIEEFMLAANETVAEHVARMELPFVYRVHEVPSEDRLTSLTEFLALFGYRLRLPRGHVHPKALQAVTEWAVGRKEEGLINTVLLRSMKQAKYLPTNEGHFGLAAEYYCHFTSPIRRYPDLIIHRVLREIVTGRLQPRRRQRLEILTSEAALQSSERERVAVEVEREVEDLLKCRFMQGQVGEEFEGIISSVTPFGFFVQLPNTVEGLVHISGLADDYYHYEERIFALVGERSKRRYRLGDAVRVQLTRVDTAARQIDFTLLGLIEEAQPTAERLPAPSLPTPVPAPAAQTAPVRRPERHGARIKGATLAVRESSELLEESAPRGRRPKRTRTAAASATRLEALPSLVRQAEPRTAPVAEPGPRRPAKEGFTEVRPERASRAAQAAGRGRAPRVEAQPRVELKRTVESPARSGGSQTDMWGIPVPSTRTASRPTSVDVRREETGTSQAPYSLPAMADRNSRRERPAPADGARRTRRQPAGAPAATAAPVARESAEGAATPAKAQKPRRSRNAGRGGRRRPAGAGQGRTRQEASSPATSDEI